MVWVGALGGLTAGAVEACPESWCTLRSPQISVSPTYPWTPQVHKDGYATKPATAQTAAAHCAAAVDTTSWKRLTASAATAGSTGAATCCVRSAVSRSGSTCASSLQVFGKCRTRVGEPVPLLTPVGHVVLPVLPENLFIPPSLLGSSGIYFLLDTLLR